MFRRHAQCPVDAVDREWVEDSFAWLTGRFGASPISGAVVLPTSEYFPGPFTGDLEQMHALVNGVAGAMGMGERVTVVPFVRGGGGGEGAAAVRGLTGCAGYPAGAFRGGEGGDVLALDQALMARPVALVATIAHMLGHLRLVGQHGAPAQRAIREHLIEVHAVYTGFGIFGANAAVEVEVDPRANTRAAGSLGLSQGRARFHHCGNLTEEVHGYALACFAFMRGESRPQWLKHLDTNPRAYTRQGLAYLAQHPAERLLAIRADIVPRTGAQTPDIS